MSRLLRTFIAVKISPEPQLLKVYANLKKSLHDEAIKWVNEKKLHLTLRFIGETTESQIHEIAEELDHLIPGFQPFRIRLKGLGYFKNKGYPRILYIKTENVEPLKEITEEIENHLCNNLGLEREQRKFKPHLTLARIKNLKQAEEFYELIKPYREMDFQQTTISEVILYRSILQPDGPSYQPLKIARLMPC